MTVPIKYSRMETEEVEELEMKISGICKAKDLIKEITFRWYGIGEKWELDETDKEIIGKN